MRNIYSKVNELLEKQEAFALATIIDNKGSVPRHLAKMIITRDLKTFGTIGGGCVEGQVAEEAALMLRNGTKGVVVKTYDLVEEEFGGVGMNCGGKIDVSIEVVEPEPRLVIIGSGHLSSSIAKLGQMLEFEIYVIDPLAKKESFPEGCHIIADFAENNLNRVPLSQSSCIVIVTRHKDDLPSLRAALKTKVGYIGLIGSRRRVAQAFKVLLDEGVSETQLEKVNAPIGLDIGAETPNEIAVSIVAEITQHRRKGLGKAAEPMRIKFASIRSIASGSEH
jgi:xanthine dehydrogenase accessory factor